MLVASNEKLKNKIGIQGFSYLEMQGREGHDEIKKNIGWHFLSAGWCPFRSRISRARCASAPRG